ncbi:hypothetical protein [Tenacibaculum aestuarii]|uniref:hypothetical protein n=1 Tax=Tenacibaculum aestuarii TaxID=362781 RepID=UPI0038934479
MKVQETGFVEFVTDLINSTVDAVISSQLDQERKYLELRKDLLLTDQQFSSKYKLEQEAKEILGSSANNKEIQEYISEYITNYKQTLKEYLNKNALKVIVDRGKVNAKLIFSFTDNNDEKKATEKRSSSSTVKKPIIIKTLFNKEITKSILADKNLIARNLSDIRPKVIVKPIDSNKDMLDLKTDIVSNVEFSFRTVVQ